MQIDDPPHGPSSAPGGPADEATISPYLPRIVDSEMSEALRASPAVLVEGPRACGKTWTGRQFAASEVMVDASTRSQLAANLDPSVLRVDADRTGEPARLVVITAGGYGFEHPEGVTVVPITALGP